MAKTSRQVVIARTHVQISTALPEEALSKIVAFVDKKIAYHDKFVGIQSDDNKKMNTMIIALLDVAAELWNAKQELEKFKQTGRELLAEVNLLDEV